MDHVVFRQLQNLSERYSNIDYEFKQIVNSLAKAKKDIKPEAYSIFQKLSFAYPTYRDAFDRAFLLYTEDGNKGARATKFDNFQKTLQKGVRDLDRLEFELGSLRTAVDKRGFGIFKFGNEKKAMDASLSPLMIRNLREDMQTLLDAFTNAHSRFDESLNRVAATQIFDWLKEYRNKQKREALFSETQRSPYEVILSV
ncbi:hypothetical protein [Legionella sp. CNM-4043-24]|uniref:hypothetical protein n=1 Tax=Legionella sp. CNM-4043-24 TaxID=3421646 RepID=UPI00403B0A3B